MNNTIFSYKTFDDVAQDISEQTWAELWKINFWNFSDWWPDIFIEEVGEKVEWKNVYYLADISTQNKLFENISVIYALTRYFSKKVNVIVPYFPTATMERVCTEWQVVTAKTIARILSATPQAEEWITSFHTFDMHDLRERFYTSDNISFRLHSCLDLIKEKLREVPNVAIAFPDEWAYKRFANDFKDYEKIICTKVRNWDKREITVKEWEVIGKNIVIVDDLIQSGWTISETAKKLRALWANTVSAYATHWVFPNNSFEKLASELDTLYTTNTIPENIERTKQISNIEVLNISELISKIITK